MNQNDNLDQIKNTDNSIDKEDKEMGNILNEIKTQIYDKTELLDDTLFDQSMFTQQ